jgi:hypothetical protein
MEEGEGSVGGRRGSKGGGAAVGGCQADRQADEVFRERERPLDSLTLNIEPVGAVPHWILASTVRDLVLHQITTRGCMAT